MNCKTSFATFIVLLLMKAANAQHEHHHHVPDSTMQTNDATTAMSSALLPNLPMQRDGSGTSWHPDSSPHHSFASIQRPHRRCK